MDDSTCDACLLSSAPGPGCQTNAKLDAFGTLRRERLRVRLRRLGGSVRVLDRHGRVLRDVHRDRARERHRLGDLHRDAAW
jgi:hypothetical protein